MDKRSYIAGNLKWVGILMLALGVLAGQASAVSNSAPNKAQLAPGNAAKRHPVAGLAGAPISKVSDLELIYADGGVRVRVHTGALTEFSHQIELPKNGKPYRIILDCLNSHHKLGAYQFRSLPSSVIKKIRTSQFAVKPQAITRIVLDLSKEAFYRVEQQPEYIDLFVTDRKAKRFNSWSSSRWLAARDTKEMKKNVKPAVAVAAKTSPAQEKAQSQKTKMTLAQKSSAQKLKAVTPIVVDSKALFTSIEPTAKSAKRPRKTSTRVEKRAEKKQAKAQAGVTVSSASQKLVSKESVSKQVVTRQTSLKKAPAQKAIPVAPAKKSLILAEKGAQSKSQQGKLQSKEVKKSSTKHSAVKKTGVAKKNIFTQKSAAPQKSSVSRTAMVKTPIIAQALSKKVSSEKSAAKATSKKGAPKKSIAKKSITEKSVAKKSIAKKSIAKKSVAKKSVAKKTVSSLLASAKKSKTRQSTKAQEKTLAKPVSTEKKSPTLAVRKPVTKSAVKAKKLKQSAKLVKNTDRKAAQIASNVRATTAKSPVAKKVIAIPSGKATKSKVAKHKVAKKELASKSVVKKGVAKKKAVEKSSSLFATVANAAIPAQKSYKERESERRYKAQFRRSIDQRKIKLKGAQVAEFPKRLTIKYRTHGTRDPFGTLLVDSPRSDDLMMKKLPNVEALTMVGILRDVNGKTRGLFEDIAGRGYILSKGDKVRNGTVLKVTREKAYFQIFEYGWSRTVALSLEG